MPPEHAAAQVIHGLRLCLVDSQIPGRAAEKASAWGSAVKEKLSFFKKKKAPKIPELIEGEFTEKEEETIPSDI